jgi:hypothetical protein
LKENNELTMVDTSKNYAGLHQPVFFFSGGDFEILLQMKCFLCEKTRVIEGS